MKHKTRRSGFTLVELLVTITIIIVLASLGFVGMKIAKRAADKAASMARMKGLGHANAIYAMDHAGKYVPVYAFDENQQATVQWHYNATFLEGLVGDTKFLENPEVHEGVDGLPEDVLDPIVVKAKKRFWSRISASYGYNDSNMPGGGWGEKGTSRSWSTSSMMSPDRTCQFITATDWIAKYSGRLIWETKPVEGKTEDGKLAFRHNNNALATFYDGHVETISTDRIKDIDKRGGVNNVFWGGKQR